MKNPFYQAVESTVPTNTDTPFRYFGDQRPGCSRSRKASRFKTTQATTTNVWTLLPPGLLFVSPLQSINQSPAQLAKSTYLQQT
ncbi:hypothetical protein Agabi119p4_1223 [Agaricus bisporus var. burnettii]|uniref:Uncharacterized protein n=1 Tax=Agaricus bisporus var. burnettii TaxID=192524 RepID=A0A8H7FCX1_AGABI|nr:hypothetical protein Agabi119p4_1223 [Agaricus bisporus var. burnettii]